MIVIVTFNHDYNEWAEAFPTREAACAAVAAAFAVDLAAAPADSPDFWDAIIEAYEVGSWKGLMLYELDPATLAMRDLALAPASDAPANAMIGGAA